MVPKERRSSVGRVGSDWPPAHRRMSGDPIALECSTVGEERVQQPETHKPRLVPPPSLEEPYEAEAPRTVLKPSLSSNGA